MQFDRAIFLSTFFLAGAMLLRHAPADPPRPTLVEDVTTADTPGPTPAEDETLPPAMLPARTPAATSEEPRGDHLTEGPWIHRSIDGRALARGTYRNACREGVWVRYFSEGEAASFVTDSFHEFQQPFRSETDFVAGQATGSCRFYDANDTLAAHFAVRAGVLHGTSEWYFANGAKRQQSAFQDGFLHGNHTVWDREAQILDEATYAEGLRLLPHQEDFDTGEVYCTGAHADTKLRVAGNFDWWRGLAETVEIGGEPRRVKHGLWTWRYDSGHRLLEGTYREGDASGTFTWWYENGQRQLAGPYVGGQPHGKFTWWHPNGQPQLCVNYANGERAGAWMSWDTAGVVVHKGDATTNPFDALSTAVLPLPGTRTR